MARLNVPSPRGMKLILRSKVWNFTELFIATFFASIALRAIGVSVIPEPNNALTFHTAGGLVLGWVFQLFKVIFIGAKIDIQFGFNVFATGFAILPVALMA
jgi:uncharacterized membrane protein